MQKSSPRPLSKKTGYLFPIYLEMQKVCKNLQNLCQYMEQTQPWYEPENRRQD